MTLREALERGATRLAAGPHPDKARPDAELLLLHATGRNRANVLAHPDAALEFAEVAHYEVLLERRAEGEPIQYILGETEFYGLPFRVTPDVLIPRPETELLVEKALALAQPFPAPRVLDLGAGSGAITIALALHLSAARITGTDISAAALAVARENARRNAVADRIRFLQGDLLAPVANEPFDLIVSNPPYVAARDRDSLSVEVRDYEPSQALFAGDDGLDVYRRLIPSAFAALVPGGFFACEIGYGQADAIDALLAGSGFSQIAFAPDLNGIARVASAQRP